MQCMNYINTLPAVLSAKGYPTASVDSIWQDSASAQVSNFFWVKQYHWIKLVPDSIEKRAIDESGYFEKTFPINY
jgi:hypothetical protein